jgi:hypothetical protein
MPNAVGDRDRDRDRAAAAVAAGLSRARAAVAALLRWWRVGRRYRPERRYMRGGGPDAGPTAAARR